MHDPDMAGLVPPGFPLVFPIPGNSDADFAEEVALQMEGETDFAIEIFAAHVHVDAQSGEVLELLRPNRGAGRVTALHQKLYSGALQPAFAVGVPYMPAICIGRGNDFDEADARMGTLNAESIAMHARADRVKLFAFDGVDAVCVEEFPLD